MTIGFSLGRSTCLSDSTIADNDTLDCLHLVLNSIATASAAWDGGQASGEQRPVVTEVKVGPNGLPRPRNDWSG